ncbi:hypothetical protein J2T41_004534 [Pseudomonas citronellolis]|uniref:hypothetical protein n=1 Tax=Pseudomonas citronellolis TaxID=53408 RepID=UPI00209F41CC|nr:hypothetical protein [Pseudomonas citronellolis]MCP1644895.1 hypothetical protein [Pseudomonas citronellolis]MCP1667840.1 hypothetical protein [Pseudomonas citronellolis]MCP1699064.1 hypothetical protein [Pseudomonas citronellolis]MCP1704947.1 hypothetical protein [Pseudomonas citronellolis]MCP1799627.1 hypothetical protein [Pseudomonas citronellolis]
MNTPTLARGLVLAVDFADFGVEPLDLFRAQCGHVSVARIELQACAFALGQTWSGVPAIAPGTAEPAITS